MLLAASVQVASGNLKLITYMPEAISGVVPFINQFTRLWIGSVQSDIFKITFNDLKSQVLPWLADLATIEDNFNLRIGHKLELCHTALVSNWNSPATATIEKDDIFWESGQSRFLAGGLCWSNPCAKHQLLAFAPNKSIVEPWIFDPVEITSDAKLEDYLGPNISNTITTRFDIVGQRISFRLSSATRTHNKKENTEKLAARVETVRQWVKQYPRGTRLDVCTTNPDLIVDSIGFWNINYINNQQETTENNHTFYTYEPVHVLDLAELLFWMDTDYTDFSDSNNKYALRSPGANRKSKKISLSHL